MSTPSLPRPASIRPISTRSSRCSTRASTRSTQRPSAASQTSTRNSVVIVLMTGVVNKLVSKATCKSSGFVAGFFFPTDLDITAPTSFSNHGEVFYSIVADSTGTLSCQHTRAEVKFVLPGTFTHEFQHMINYVQHVLARPGQPEEGWLDEGLSEYAEELAGRSYLPGDTVTFSNYAIDDVFDAYQYLSATGTSPLLIELDQGPLAAVAATWP